MAEDAAYRSNRDLVGQRSFELPEQAYPCPYFGDRTALNESYVAADVDPDDYHELMNRNFRRSGVVFYRPRCQTCALCRQIRVPVAEFAPSRSQRRVARRNADLLVTLGVPRLTREKHALYQRYLAAQHPGSSQTDDLGALRDFLYTTAVVTAEVEYRLPDGQLVGLSFLDVSRASFSSVYHFFDPDHARRSIGVFSVLKEIELAGAGLVPWYYLGYWIDGCKTMQYKADYLPHEVWVEGVWQRVAAR